MPFIINLALVMILAVTGAPRESRAAPEPHDFTAQGMECRSCHKTVVLQTRGSMQKPIKEMCAACHKLSTHSSHPVDMKPSFAVPADMPLDERGLMTCATCHDPHRRYLNALTGEKTLYLRRDGPRKKFCLACHGRRERSDNDSGEAKRRIPEEPNAR